MWESISPGSTVAFERSMTLASAGIDAAASVTFSMRSPRTNTSWFFLGALLVPSISVPARITVKAAAPCPPLCPNELLPVNASTATAHRIRFRLIEHPHKARLACRKATADCNPLHGERHSGLFLPGVGLQFRFCLRFFVSAGIRDQIEGGIFVFFDVVAGAGVLDLGRDIDGRGFGGVDDSGSLVGINLREGAEEQAADVGKNGGATRGNTVLGQERVEVV